MGWRNFTVCSEIGKIDRLYEPIIQWSDRPVISMPDPSNEPLSQSENEADAGATLAAAVGFAEAVTLTFDSGIGRVSRRATLQGVTDSEVNFTLSRANADLLAEAAERNDFRIIVSLRVKGDEIVFFSAAPMIEYADEPEANNSASIRSKNVAVALPLPDQLIVTRPRQGFRIVVAREDAIQLRVWRIDDYAVLRDTPPPSRSFPAEIYDISAHGLRAMLMARPVAAMQLCFDQRFRIEITEDGVPIIFDARLRHPRMSNRDDEYAFCGFEFTMRHDSIEGRRAEQRLDALLAKLQRVAARRQSSAA
jgi:hypothetical protein